MSSSPKRKAQLKKARSKQKQRVALVQSSIDSERYVIAALTEGLGETQARRFLAKINIKPPDKKTFYKAQTKIAPYIEKLVADDLKTVRSLLLPDSIFGLDCSWSGRRGAEHAIVIFMEMRTKLIFDKVIISKKVEISDIEFHSTSNLMESEAVKSKVEEFSKSYKFIGFVHDFDVDTAPLLNSNESTGDLIEYLDPGHLKKTMENLYKKHNVDGSLYQLKGEIMERYAIIVHNSKLTIEEKVAMWRDIPNDIIKKGRKKGYLVALNDSSSRQRRISPKIARAALDCFISETEWLIRKCSLFNTQAIESFNASCKAKLSPKHLHFQKSFRIRNHLAIIKWNHPNDWFDLIEDALKLSELTYACRRVLTCNNSIRAKERAKSHDEKVMIMRNRKRKISRMKNRIDPEGHLYAGDLKKDIDLKVHEKRRTDPSRTAVVIRVPYISNQLSTNCFINSVIQLLRHSNINKAMQLCSKHDAIDLMTMLNKGISITSASVINTMRKTWSQFNTLLQEDSGEFYVWLLNEIYDKRLQFKEISHDIEGLLSRKPEPLTTKYFTDEYQYSIQRTIACSACQSTHITLDHGFLFIIPSTFDTFEQNLNEALHYKVDYNCTESNAMCCATVYVEFVELPNFLVFQFNRFLVEEGIITKDEKAISFPSKYVFGSLNYELVGIIYHIGQTQRAGHYLAKYINHDGSVETYDDSRCYRNYGDTKIPEKNAYMLFYQKSSNRKDTKPEETDDIRRFAEAKLILKRHFEEIQKKKACSPMEKQCSKVCKKSKTSTIEKAKRDVSPEKIRNYFRDNSWYCDLYCFDHFHCIDSFDDFHSTFIATVRNYIAFPGYSTKGFFKFFQSFCHSGCIRNESEYFCVVYKIVIDENIDSKEKNRNIQNFLYLSMTELDDPVCFIADQLVDHTTSLSMIEMLVSLFDEDSIIFNLFVEENLSGGDEKTTKATAVVFSDDDMPNLNDCVLGNDLLIIDA